MQRTEMVEKLIKIRKKLRETNNEIDRELADMIVRSGGSLIEV